jgi:pimeloyl-ACP methyl ester carboxylesterase
VAGARARLDRDAFSGDDPAAAVGEPVRDVRYTSGGDTLPAWFVPGREDTWVVFVHGALGSDREEPLRAMRVTAGLGMPSLDITYRNDLGAPQDPSGRYQYGRTEWRDLEGAVQYAVDHEAERVVLMGFSMGGAVVAAFLERSELAPEVSGVVLDSPALDLRTMIEYGAAQRRLPLVGGLPRSLVWTAEQVAAVRDDVDWEAIDYVDDSDWLRVPGLVFHGDDDLKVPVALSRSLAADHPDTVTLDVVHGAGHVESWNADPAAYERTLRTFLEAT